jgi:hypothetical protein
MDKAVDITRKQFLEDRQGRTFLDVLDDREQPFDEVLDFFNNLERQRRMEESEIHHDRAPLAGIVRELESYPKINKFLAEVHAQRTTRLRQAIGVLVRMIMESRGWQKTGRKGSLGVRAEPQANVPHHNSGGLALWFIRAERYELKTGMPYQSTETRCEEVEGQSNRKAQRKSFTDSAEKTANNQASIYRKKRR